MNAAAMREHLLDKYNGRFDISSESAIQKAIGTMFQKQKSREKGGEQRDPRIRMPQRYRDAIDELLSSSGW